ncbi:MAG: heparan-alpha-glucosaminide N-acetyltransferase domain-containing protein [Myxococcales bacterium]
MQRVIAIDFGRGASVFVMMLVHTLLMYGRPDVQTSATFGMPIHFAGRGAAMFLVAMGFSFALSEKTPTQAARRGATLFALGYVMNLLSFLVPYFGQFMPESFVRSYGFVPPIQPAGLLYLLLTGDVLQLAGISAGLMALLRGLLVRPYFVLASSLAVALVSSGLRGYRPQIAGLDYLCDLMWAADSNVFFPVFPWLSVILYGVFLGRLYQHAGCDVERLLRVMLRLGLALAVVGYVLCQVDPATHYGDFFHGGFGSMLASMGSASMLFCLAHWLTPFFVRSRLADVLYRASERVTQLYVIQWVLLCWGMGLVGFQQHGELAVLGLTGIVMVLALASDRLLQEATHSLRPRPSPAESSAA